MLLVQTKRPSASNLLQQKGNGMKLQKNVDFDADARAVVLLLHVAGCTGLWKMGRSAQATKQAQASRSSLAYDDAAGWFAQLAEPIHVAGRPWRSMAVA